MRERRLASSLYSPAFVLLLVNALRSEQVYLLHQQCISLLIITSIRHVIRIHGPFFYAAVRQSFTHFQIACFSLVMKIKMFLCFFAVAYITNREAVVDGMLDSIGPILS